VSGSGPPPEPLARQLSDWRRHLHAHPEPSREESGTAAWLSGELASLGIDHHTGIGGHGVLALPAGEGKGIGPAVLLRADMDALPIQEENDVPYASLRAGTMHACGHDAHMACLLGALALLAEDPPRAGRAIGLFQPAEEVSPGGAAAVISTGLLESEGVAAVLAQHVDHTLPVGQLGIRPGPMMAEADEFDVSFSGPGGHGSEADRIPDPLRAGAVFLGRLADVITPVRDQSTTPLICSVGQMGGGTAPNVIAGSVLLSGTLRTYEQESAAAARAAVEGLALQVAEGTGTGSEVVWRMGGPPVLNDTALTGACRERWQERLGADRVTDLEGPSLAAEDFGHFTARLPGVYWRLGIRGKESGGEPWHTARFDIDEEALPVGAVAMAEAARAVLAELVDR